MNKRLLALLLCLCMAVGLCACKSNEEVIPEGDEDGSQSVIETEEETLFALLTDEELEKVSADQWEWEQISEFVEKYFEIYNVGAVGATEEPDEENDEETEGGTEKEKNIILVAKESYFTESGAGMAALLNCREQLNDNKDWEDIFKEEKFADGVGTINKATWNDLQKEWGQPKAEPIDESRPERGQRPAEQSEEVGTGSYLPNGGALFEVKKLNESGKLILIAQPEYFKSEAWGYNICSQNDENLSSENFLSEELLQKLKNQTDKHYQAQIELVDTIKNENYKPLKILFGLIGDAAQYDEENSEFWSSLNSERQNLNQNGVEALLRMVSKNLVTTDEDAKVCWEEWSLAQKKALVKQDMSVRIYCGAPFLLIGFIPFGVFVFMRSFAVRKKRNRKKLDNPQSVSENNSQGYVGGQNTQTAERNLAEIVEKSIQPYDKKEGSVVFPQRKTETPETGSDDNEKQGDNDSDNNGAGCSGGAGCADKIQHPVDGVNSDSTQHPVEPASSGTKQKRNNRNKPVKIGYLAVSEQSRINRTARAEDHLGLTRRNLTASNEENCPYVLLSNNTIWINSVYKERWDADTIWETMIDAAALNDVYDIIDDETGHICTTAAEISELYARKKLMYRERAVFEAIEGRNTGTVKKGKLVFE